MNRLRLFRLHHWCKNLLIFFPIFFSGRLFHSTDFRAACFIFLAFSLVASGIYCRNDVKDVAADRLHSKKRHRPIAAGHVSVKEGLLWAYLLPLGGLILAYETAHQALAAVLILVIYWGINIAYSAGLKQVPLVDIALLATGFLLRLYAGSVATNIAVSNWLYLTVMTAALYLALGKRLKESLREKNMTRQVLRRYHTTFLQQYMTITQTLTLAFYSLWALNEDTARHLGTNLMVWSVPLVFFIFMRYGMKIDGDADGDPIAVLTEDPPLIAMVTSLFVLASVLIYY